MKSINFLILFLFLFGQLNAQDIYYTKTAELIFDSSTPLETIHAVNQQATSFINIKTGEINFAALVRSFKFKNSLMEEHFNENFVESDQFPKAVFKGKIVNVDQLDFEKGTSQTIEIEGDLTLHGVSKTIKTEATLTSKNDKIVAISSFIVTPDNFKITIPNAVKDKIAKEVKVSVNATYQAYRK